MSGDPRLAGLLPHRPVRVIEIVAVWARLAPALGLPSTDSSSVAAAAHVAVGRDSGAFLPRQVSAILDRLEVDLRASAPRFEIVTLPDGRPAIADSLTGTADNWRAAVAEWRACAREHRRRHTSAAIEADVRAGYSRAQALRRRDLGDSTERGWRSKNTAKTASISGGESPETASMMKAA